MFLYHHLISYTAGGANCFNKNNTGGDVIKLKNAYKHLDFKDIAFKSEVNQYVTGNIIVKIESTGAHKITHTLPKINRCCKIDALEYAIFDSKDKIPRDKCSISKAAFHEKYVERREPVLLMGCHRDWLASNWTLRGISFT